MTSAPTLAAGNRLDYLPSGQSEGSEDLATLISTLALNVSPGEGRLGRLMRTSEVLVQTIEWSHGNLPIEVIFMSSAVAACPERSGGFSEMACAAGIHVSQLLRRCEELTYRGAV